jgi:ribulose-phosphate 3-epimerase
VKNLYLSPSLLSADFMNIERQFKLLEAENINRIHLDVMDGHFVPNISFGAPVIKSLREKSNFVFETHLMIKNPEKYIDSFKEAGSDIIIFHQEATEEPIYLIDKIKSLDMKAGISIKPNTPWEEIGELLHLVDMILIMSVEPGFGGQKYMPETAKKMKFMFEYMKDQEIFDVDIAIDGGINESTLDDAIINGANIFIAGSSLFNKDLEKMSVNIKNLNQILNKYK